MAGLNLLTGKKVIYAANVNEDDLADNGDSNPHVKALRALAAAEGAQVVIVSAQVRDPRLLGSSLWYRPGLCHCRFRYKPM